MHIKETIFHFFVVLCNSCSIFSLFLDRFVIITRTWAKGVRVLVNGDACNVFVVRVGWGKE